MLRPLLTVSVVLRPLLVVSSLLRLLLVVSFVLRLLLVLSFVLRRLLTVSVFNKWLPVEMLRLGGMQSNDPNKGEHLLQVVHEVCLL